MIVPKLRAALLFYRHYCTVPLLLIIPGAWLYMLNGLLVPLLIVKVAANALVWYFIYTIRQDGFYYFYNLHVSRTFLFLTWLLADLFLFCTVLWLTTLM